MKHNTMKKLLKKVITSLVAEELAPLKKEVIGVLIERDRRMQKEEQVKRAKEHNTNKGINITINNLVTPTVIYTNEKSGNLQELREKVISTIVKAINLAVSKATNNN
jgi:hypothetical protein